MSQIVVSTAGRARLWPAQLSQALGVLPTLDRRRHGSARLAGGGRLLLGLLILVASLSALSLVPRLAGPEARPPIVELVVQAVESVSARLATPYGEGCSGEGSLLPFPGEVDDDLISGYREQIDLSCDER